MKKILLYLGLTFAAVSTVLGSGCVLGECHSGKPVALAFILGLFGCCLLFTGAVFPKE